MHAGAGADIEHVVGQADGVFIVLDDDHRVADVAQVAQGAEQALVVALVQTDRRFVEDVHDAHQPGADLAGQADTLRFAAGKGIGATVQGQVVEADVDQELQALADFLENLVGDLAASAAQCQAAEIFGRIPDRQCGDGRQRLVADPHVACLAAQARAATFWAGLGAEVLGQFFADAVGFRFAIAAFEIGDDPFERMRALDDVATVVEIAEVDAFLATAAQDALLMLLGQ